ncbi:DUF6461 domain-containing protein [Streptomyces galilaeus]
MSSSEVDESLFRAGYPGFCLTFSRNLTPEAVLERYGANPSMAENTGPADANLLIPREGDGTLLRVGELGAWSFCFESPGVEGAMPWTLAELSRETETLAYNRGAKGMDIVERWADGQPLEQFEPAVFNTLRAVGAPLLWEYTQRHPEGRGGEDVSPRRVRAVALQAIHDRVGSHVTNELLIQPLLSVWLPLRTHQVRPAEVAYPPRVSPASTSGLGSYLGSLPPLEE